MAKKQNGKAAAPAADATPPAPAPPAPGGNRPVKEIRLGRIRVSAWRNVTTDGTVWFSFTLSRSYKDEDNQWKTASSLGMDDLLVAAEVLRQARLWVEDERQGLHRPEAVANAEGTATPAHEAGPSDPIPF
jgi:hypothetical protein